MEKRKNENGVKTEQREVGRVEGTNEKILSTSATGNASATDGLYIENK